MKNLSVCRQNGILLLLLPAFCFSQNQRQNMDDAAAASCSGNIYDNITQKPLNGAKIIIINTEKNKKITTTTSNIRGYYSFVMNPSVDIEVEVTMSGYKKTEKSFTKAELNRNKWRIPDIYLDTTIKIDLKPAAPLRQSKEEFVDNKLQSKNVLPGPGAYELLLYLNPDLRGRDSLMSNDNIVLPKIPIISRSMKRANKEPFQAAKGKDNATQNRLRDTIDKVARILGDDINTYKIKYENTSVGSVKQMRDYIRMDLQDYRSQISTTSKLKAEGMIDLLSKMGELHQKMISQRELKSGTYNNMKLLWEDLSYLLQTKRYMLFTRSDNLKKNQTEKGFMNAAYLYSGPATNNSDAFKVARPGTADSSNITTAPPFYRDEVGYFGILIWSEKLTSATKPDLSEPGSRYLIRYFKPALAADTSRYELCTGVANVATANLTRARYGLKVYDTKEKRYVETVDPTFTTEPAFASSKYDAWFTPDFKEIKYIIIHLK